MTKNITKKTLHSIILFISVTIGLSTLLLNMDAEHTITITAQAEAKSTFEVSGWIPYWGGKEGIQDARAHLSKLTRLYAFAYGVDKNGNVKAETNLETDSWKKLFASAKSKGVPVIPTIMSGDGAHMHKILSNEASRAAHIQSIVSMVEKGKYAGVDIDYEAKLITTKDYFSAFIMELKTALGNKTLICTIEARTPADSLYRVPPPNPKHSNDYAVLGTYCDRVQLMTYDQQRADIKLNDSKSGLPYAPVSDVDWVRKVVELTVQSIPREKLVLGVATYGREYEITVSPNRFQDYKRLRAINAEGAEEMADDKKVAPSRNQAGEMSFSYLPKTSKLKFSKSLSVPKNTSSGNEIAAKALAHANATGKTVKFNIVWWSDAKAVEDKVKLAKEFGLAGIAIFKIDGQEDEKIWDLF